MIAGSTKRGFKLLLSKHKLHVRRHIIAEVTGAIGGGFFVAACLQKSMTAGGIAAFFLFAAVFLDFRNIESEEKEVEVAAASAEILSKEEIVRVKEIIAEWPSIKNTAENAYACAVGSLPVGGTAHKVAGEVVTTGLSGVHSGRYS
jgi:hypothetical protein